MFGTSSTSPLAGLLATSTLLLAGACAQLGDAPLLPQPQSVTIESVADGDSFRGWQEAVMAEFRLEGINAPELDECHGPQAKEELRALISERVVEVVASPEPDQFGRTLTQVLVDDANINLAMVGGGHAIATSDADFFQQQDEARQAGLGLWSATACGAESELPALAIVSIDYNPPGDDSNETVVIANHGGEAVDLAGFVLRDESSVNRFVFPLVTISPGQEVTINTGCDQPNGLNWCSPQPVWNNSGDSALLLDPHGRVVALLHY